MFSAFSYLEEINGSGPNNVILMDLTGGTNNTVNGNGTGIIETVGGLSAVEGSELTDAFRQVNLCRMASIYETYCPKYIIQRNFLHENMLCRVYYLDTTSINTMVAPSYHRTINIPHTSTNTFHFHFHLPRLHFRK